MSHLKICYVTSELTPFAKVGGLADVAAALPRTLHEAGHDVRVFLPLYKIVDYDGRGFSVHESIHDVPVTFGGKTYRFTLVTAEQPGTDLVLHFIHCPALYDRGGVYTSDHDEHLRFLMLCRAAVDCCQLMQWGPDVFHCNDWETALLPLYLKTTYAWDKLFRQSRTLLTIHNLGYQGVFPRDIFPQLGLDGGADLFPQDDFQSGRIPFLKTGILYADVLTTVSPTYAEEIQSEALGMGLDGMLKQRSHDLVGILNGVDYEEWNPRTDRNIPFRYSHRSLWRKAKNKEYLLDEMKLPHTKETPLVGMISRLTAQKGLDLLFEALPDLLNRRDFRFVLLGTGEERYVTFFKRLQARFPEKVCFHHGFSNELAHILEAASDIFLMPSQYEPCGLNQMYSLKYGTVPVVRKTGGLADTVQLFDPHTGEGNGIVFDHYMPDGLRWAVGTALDLYEDTKAWRLIMQNGMAADFSWETQAEKYLALYRRLAGR